MEIVFPIYVLIGMAAVVVWFAQNWRAVRAKRDTPGATAAIFTRVFSLMLGWPIYAVLAMKAR